MGFRLRSNPCRYGPSTSGMRFEGRMLCAEAAGGVLAPWVEKGQWGENDQYRFPSTNSTCRNDFPDKRARFLYLPSPGDSSFFGSLYREYTANCRFR